MKSYLIILSLAILLFSCNNSKNKTNPKKQISNTTKNVDTIINKNDTLVYIEKISTNASIFHWGINGKFNKISKDTIPFSYLNKDKIEFKDDYIYIIDGCGSGCEYIYIMSFKTDRKDFLRFYPLFFDTKKHIVVYKNEDENNLITVENILNNKTLNIVEDYNKHLRPPSIAIDSIYVENNNKIFVKWQNLKQRSVEKRFDIEELFK